MSISALDSSPCAAGLASSGGRFCQRSGAVSLPAATVDSVIITVAARMALEADSTAAGKTAAADPVSARLAEIKGKDALSRTTEDSEYLWANDAQLQEIRRQGKSPDQLTAEQLDYVQKACGFVNTMATLSPAEKALYDKAVASGNSQAAAGLAQIAMIRVGGHLAGGAAGTTYDPQNTAITASNVERYFSYSIVDPSGDAAAKFRALAQFLRDNAPTT